MEPITQPRIDYKQPAHVRAMQAMSGLEKYVRGSGLEQSLLELVKTRASQINGCAFCLDMHTKDARAQGETEQRLYTLSAWRETPFFSARERAALEWTEELTRISESNVPDELYDRVRQHFSEEEVVNLTLAIIAINGWNRIAISFRSVPGSYQPPAAKQSAEDVPETKSTPAAPPPAAVAAL
jgi:AhpD family alkylhydroperoxidase